MPLQKIPIRHLAFVLKKKDLKTRAIFFFLKLPITTKKHYFITSSEKNGFYHFMITPVNSPARYRFTCPKLFTKFAIRDGLRDVTADSDIKCHITLVLSAYSP